MLVSDRIQVFSRFLSASWDVVEVVAATSEDHDQFFEDWAQANWELLVESSFGGPIFLAPYNGGADVHGDSYRVTYPKTMPTHVVVISARSTVFDALSKTSRALPEDGIRVEQLVSMQNGWYVAKPPFQHVRVTMEGSAAIFALADVDCRLRTIREDD